MHINTVLTIAVIFLEKSLAGKILIVKEQEDVTWTGLGEESMEEVIITIDRNDESDSTNKVCTALKDGISILLDLTWTGLDEVFQIINGTGLPYIRAEPEIVPFLRTLDRTITDSRDVVDSALIFQDAEGYEQSLQYLILESSLRVALFNNLDNETSTKLINMRPTPSFNAIFGKTEAAANIYKKAFENKLIKLHDRWALVLTDMHYENLGNSLFEHRTNIYNLNNNLCCDEENNCTCSNDFNLNREYLAQLKIALREAIANAKLSELSITVDCENTNNIKSDNTLFYDQLNELSGGYHLLQMDLAENLIRQRIIMDWKLITKQQQHPKLLGKWDSKTGLIKHRNIEPIKRFFRIATGYSIPFAYPVIDENTKNLVYNEDGSEKWEGYCIDLIERLSQEMNFEYELSTSYDYGKKLKNGTWSGLVGQLATGKIDMIVGALTMTSEREEVIDFVAPYYEQTGFSIVIRKPFRKTSLFKFMTVLRVEVWISILGALCLTAIMIWLLEKYSPYSAKNNKEKYSYPCRDFTLRESFWFAVTSFTPQGGGEAPKALSSRTLVAAYWLFVVLMLATFTANLAAFLTVERMQNPVQSLKQLARQSRINYTVVRNSEAHAYFRNMKFAEETLYRVWKEITLNSSADQSQYRVWDYPIKEQYAHILIAMEKTGTLESAEEGFKKVSENEDAEFAMIHDALEIKYQVYKDCNLTEIGEPFAEQPYAIAVQQGSHLNEEISRRILDLQSDRYFEALSAKFWNATMKNKCDSYDEDEGITLESLGGVFIATLVGLLLAMLTLGAEVLYEKKKKSKKVKAKEDIKIPNMLRDEFLTAKEFGHVRTNKIKAVFNPEQKPKVNYITVYPRGQLY